MMFERLPVLLCVALVATVLQSCSEEAAPATEDRPLETATSAEYCSGIAPTEDDDCRTESVSLLCGDDPHPRAGFEIDARELLDCRAIAYGDASFCDLEPVEVQANCRARYAFFSAARAEDPDWPTVMANAIDVECRDGVPDEICDAMFEAISAQRAGDCPQIDGIAQLCQALASSDPEPCGGDADCEELAGRMELLAQGGGLEHLSQSGTLRDRACAGAVLGGVRSCDELLSEPYHQRCRGEGD